jgi:alpha-glucosidase (family GH31 glycosyl hydrolase)
MNFKIKPRRTRIGFFPGIFLIATLAATASPESVVVGNVRVQLLSGSLVRFELRGPAGFENRNTFHVLNRNWPGIKFSTNVDMAEIVIKTSDYFVRVPQNAMSLAGVRVESPGGKTLYTYTGRLENSEWLPGPSENPQAWSFADSPRMIPPPWGLTPAPANAELPETGGWDLQNDAPDVYVFLPGGDYRQLRKDFLKLTGPTEMPPLFLFGAFDSRWFDYSEATALKQIDDYRARNIPLDVLVVDTGWRAGASTGYQPNTNLFPDMARFIREAHGKNVRVLFNDHPEPTGLNGLDPVEMKFRYDGLSGLLNDGLDVWWYDRNWMVHLVPPMPNLNKEVWGMRLYHDITQNVRPEQRPLIMANVDGIDNGFCKRPMDVAAHRFPFQWTGDISPSYESLQRGVENAVHAGVQSLFPYMSEDLGGHISDPTPEAYIRWIEYGALSPVYRPHCTHNLTRMPWTFGTGAEEVARRFLDMRYRLLPVFYAAARKNYETGEPLLRRLDLDYPQFAEAGQDDEYLIGKGILVAPVLQGPLQIVPADWLKTVQSEPGLSAEYFANDTLSGSPTLTRTDRTVDFDWGFGIPGPRVPNTHFTARWTGTIQVPPEVGDVILATIEDDGARVWIDGKQIIDAWGPHDSATTEASAVLTAGKPHQLRIEYLQLEYKASLRLKWRQAAVNNSTARVVWIPPGDWINAWNGETLTGPIAVTNQTPLDQIPLFIRSGTLLPLAPEMQFTGQLPWDPITLDIYPQAGETNSVTLYEDDTTTTAYQRGQFRKTFVSVSADHADKKIQVTINAANGNFPGALKQRSWILRIHSPTNWPDQSAITSATVNGKKIESPIRRLTRDETAMPFGDAAGAPDGDVFELKLSPASVYKIERVELGIVSRFQPPR